MKAGRYFFQRLLVTVSLGLMTIFSHAEDIAIVASADTPAYTNLSEHIQNTIEQHDRSANVSIYLHEDEDRSAHNVTIALGSEAQAQVKQEDIVSFIQPLNFPQQSDIDVVSIYPELGELIAFAQSIAAQHRNQDIIIPISQTLFDHIDTGNMPSTKVRFIVIDESDKVTKAVKPWLYKPAIILAIPDDKIWSGNQARWLLLKAYEHKVPVIGYSQAFLKAGAMASLFIKKEQIVSCIAELAVHQTCKGSNKNSIYYPEYTIEFNPSITQALKFNHPNFKE